MVRFYAVAAMAAALAPFQWSAKPLPQPLKSQLEERGFWHKGCPVGLGDLRLLTVSHLGYDGASHRGQLVVNERATGPLSRAFRAMYRNRFPIRHMQLADGALLPRSQPAAARDDRRPDRARVRGRGLGVGRLLGGRHQGLHALLTRRALTRNNGGGTASSDA